jgi:SAM-dependent methyltransferase
VETTTKEVKMVTELKINIGCGMVQKEGFIRADNDPAVKPDVLLDVEKDRFPWEDNSVAVIYSKSCLEHVHDLTNFFEESYRVLNKETGYLHLNLPYYLHETSFTDPEHIWFFTPSFFTQYLQRPTTGSDGRPVITGNFDYELVSLTRIVHKEEASKFKQALEKHISPETIEAILPDIHMYLTNVVRSLEIILKPKFPFREPATDLPPTYVRLKR